MTGIRFTLWDYFWEAVTFILLSILLVFALLGAFVYIVATESIPKAWKVLRAWINA